MKNLKLFNLIIITALIMFINPLQVNGSKVPETCSSIKTWSNQKGENYHTGDCVSYEQTVKSVIIDFTSNGDLNWFYSHTLFDHSSINEPSFKELQNNYKQMMLNKDPKLTQAEINMDVFKKNIRINLETLLHITLHPTQFGRFDEYRRQYYIEEIGFTIDEKAIQLKLRVDRLLADGVSLDDALAEVHPKIGRLSNGDFTYDVETGKLTQNMEK